MLSALIILGLAIGVHGCPKPNGDVKAVMKVYDQDPKAFRRKLNTRLPDD